MNSINSSIDRDLLIASYSFINNVDAYVKRLQGILEMAVKICDVKSAFITLLGNSKQDILSQRGIELESMDIQNSICQYTIQGTDLLMITDTSKDERVNHLGLHKSKHKMFFYAGYPLYNDDRQCIGALCVSHDKPTILTENQKTSLSILANNTMKDLDNQRSILNMITALDNSYHLDQIQKNSNLQLELARHQKQMIEQKKIAEQQNVSLLQSNENLKTFAHTAAHDIKSPARVIYSFSQLMNDKLQNSSDITDVINYTKIIQTASKNLLELISSILNYAESESTELEISLVDLKDILNTVRFNLSETIQTSGAQIVDLVGSNYVHGHKEQLIQLFQNLIGNGLKFQDGSKPPKIKIEYKSFKSKIAISISDNGIGIQDKNLYKIFNPFRRLNSSSKFDGTGLGLSTCLNVLKNHGSHICVVSDSSGGTTFTFSLTKASPKELLKGERVQD